ncbi:hypothetical protein, conserved [Plasmodium vivax]|uniref:Uncharacterized protein n=1 Tax=Plasmodium vivax TaxID=5855 RepID=A0A1G4HC68_PLAVI|nr:hypothetical protein, conserved [Plasmodium vivax]
MKQNKEIFNESSQKHSTCLCHSVYYKKSKLCIHSGGMCLKDRKKFKKYIPKCSPKDLSLNFSNFRLNGLYNKATIKFTKLIVIYQLLILQFPVVIGNNGNDCPNGNITKYLCQFCVKFSIALPCEKPTVSISVTVLFFLFVITMFSLICCNCRCGKKKGNKYAEYGRFIMGPDGKMYDRLMMNPQMLQDGKIPEEMLQEGMQEQEMRGPEVQEPGMQETDTKEPGRQHTERNVPRFKERKLQETDMNENEKKTKNKNSSTDYKNPNDDELHVGYKPF